MPDHLPTDAELAEMQSRVAALEAELAEARQRATALEAENTRMNDAMCQSLGKALGYPWFKDDQQNFPGSTSDNGVCVGDHVAESLADEAARTITRLRVFRNSVVRYVNETPAHWRDDHRCPICSAIDALERAEDDSDAARSAGR